MFHSADPLIFLNDSSRRWTLFGTLQGGGYDCGSDTVYTFEGSDIGLWNKVGFHMEWIQKTMKDLGETICNPD